MQTHEIEVVIPEDHRLTVEVPETIRSGPAKLKVSEITQIALKIRGLAAAVSNVRG